MPPVPSSDVISKEPKRVPGVSATAAAFYCWAGRMRQWVGLTRAAPGSISVRGQDSATPYTAPHENGRESSRDRRAVNAGSRADKKARTTHDQRARQLFCRRREQEPERR